MKHHEKFLRETQPPGQPAPFVLRPLAVGNTLLFCDVNRNRGTGLLGLVLVVLLGITPLAAIGVLHAPPATVAVALLAIVPYMGFCRMLWEQISVRSAVSRIYRALVFDADRGIVHEFIVERSSAEMAWTRATPLDQCALRRCRVRPPTAFASAGVPALRLDIADRYWYVAICEDPLVLQDAEALFERGGMRVRPEPEPV